MVYRGLDLLKRKVRVVLKRGFHTLSRDQRGNLVNRNTGPLEGWNTPAVNCNGHGPILGWT